MANDAAPASPAAAPAAVEPQPQLNQNTNSNQPGQPAQQVKSDAKPAQPTAAQAKKWATKVDGKEVTWEREEELLRDAGLGKAAFNRMRDAAEVTRKVNSFMEKLKTDPMAALEDPSLGLSEEKRREIIEKYYAKKYLETDNMTPEQKELAELREYRRQQEETRQRAEQEAQEAEKTQRQQAMETEWRERYQGQIIEALEKGQLPKRPRVAGRVAAYMSHAAESGFDAPLEAVVKQVQDDYVEEISDLLHDEVPIEAILKVLPPNLVKRLRQHDLDQYKKRREKGTGTPPPSEPVQPASPRKQRDERLSYSEVLKKLGG